MHLRRSLTFTSVLVLLATLLVVPGAQAAPDKGRYIVVLKDAVSRPAVVAKGHGKAYGAQVKHVYKNTIKGYSAKLNKNKLAKLRSDPKVALVVKDGVARIAKKGGNRPPKDPPDGGGGGGGNCGYVGSWGQDRIDQRRGVDGCYDPTSHGAGATAYILDTGVDPSHSEYASRIPQTGSWYDAVSGGPARDCHGHGTHVAGTIGGSRYGVAQAVGIVGVRVLECNGSGTWGDIIEGLDWVAGQSVAKKVANLSLSGPRNEAMDLAVARATLAGVTVVVAAGNNYGNACNYSPAGASAAITVGATNSSDRKASYSNSGTCVDLFAPGHQIVSALPAGGSGTKSGTSMAAPHVAGVAAILLGQGTAPGQIAGEIKQTATSGRIKSEGRGSPDLLLYIE